MFKSIRNNLSRTSDSSSLSMGLDFLPSGYAERRRRRRTNAVCLVLFAAVVSAVGTTFYFSEKTLASVESEYRSVEDSYTGAARQIEQVKQMLLKRKTVADRVELAVSLRERLPRSNVLAEVTNALPPGITLTDAALEARRLTTGTPAPQTSFEQRMGQNAPAPAPQPLAFETTLLVTGVSYTEGQVSDYIDALHRSNYFSAVDLRWVRRGSNIDRKDESMRTFVILLTLDPQAEARPLETRLRPVLRGQSTANTDTTPAAGGR